MIPLWPSFPENQMVVPSQASFLFVPPAEDPRPPFKRLRPGEHIYANEVEPGQTEPIPWTVNLSMTLSDASLILFPVGDECVIEAALHHGAFFGCSYLTRIQSPLIDTLLTGAKSLSFAISWGCMKCMLLPIETNSMRLIVDFEMHLKPQRSLRSRKLGP